MPAPLLVPRSGLIWKANPQHTLADSQLNKGVSQVAPGNASYRLSRVGLFVAAVNSAVYFDSVRILGEFF